MSLPVSHYEALLAEVRGLRRKAERVQQLAQPLIVGTRSQRFQNDSPLDYTMESLLAKRQHNTSDNSPNYDQRSSGSEQDRVSSEDECRLRDRASRSQMSVSSEPVTNQTPIDSMYHGAWPNVPRTLWNSEPASLGKTSQSRKNSTAFDGGYQNEVASVMSFASSSGGAPIDSALCNAGQNWSSQQLEAKMDVVNSLLSMLGSQEHVDMGETLLALSTCQESCLAMRQSGCIPLLVQLVQSDKDNDTRKKAAHALHNLVNSQPDEQIRKRELRILKLLDDVRQYIECLKYNMEFQSATYEPAPLSPDDDGDRHPVQTIAHLMKLSFDESHRQAICLLGGIYTTATLVETEHTLHGNAMQNGNCILMRRYACMTLTNLTFGDSGNKTLLCSFKEFMRNLVQQLQSPSDELRQVTASVLRNLSWRADSTSKEILREVGSVTGLMKAAMIQNKENTLKSILSALWNLSAHCTENKSEICGVADGLGFIVNMLTYKTPSKSLAIIENAGGILRNISSQIAVRDDYREILRQHNCLHILLEQLKSPSLTIVSNACGTLWNLSAKNAEDQEALWQMGAPAMLRSLNHSKHKMIAMGSSAALKNLISCRPQQSLAQKMDSTALALNLPELPTLGARKQKALLQDLDQNLTETYENIDKDSPVKSNATTGAAGFLSGNRATLTSPDHFVNAFASLNLNEPSTSYGAEFRHKSKIPQNFGGSSLPYVPQSNRRSNPASFLPVRTKFSGRSYEDDTPEQPIDYSRKYSETTVGKKINPSGASSDLRQTDNSRIYANQKEVNFTIGYTETDLDQPTDYSLRYADDDSYSDICGKITKQEFVQDTVKTYCTEGTPYESPFVFSNATSMSDLRNVGNMDDKPEIDNDIQKELDKKDNKETKHVDEKDRCSTEDISEMENTVGKPQKSEFSSGIMTPEKPVNYCEEGTPSCFSRVSSFSSDLDSIQVKQEANLDTSGLEQKTTPGGRDKISTTPKTPNEAKVVKFEQVVNYAEQTPLVFSRSSSLASLDSIEQHSIHDDRSSVVSDFRTSSVRLTSGMVSPSELPDSPTQTVPSSPRSSKGKLGFPHSSKQLRDNKQRLPQKSSVFEDNTTKYKEENTPMHFSTATSLSSLTIDDHEDPGNASSSSKTPDTKVLQPLERRPCLGAECELYDQQGDQQEKKDIEKESRCEEDSCSDDDKLLAAYMNDGIQSNISAPTASTASTMLISPNYKYQHMKMPGGTGIPLMRRTPPRHLSSTFPSEAPTTYCTEDTPAELSRTGSCSNLSTLSIPTEAKSKVGDFSDDSSNLDEESEQLLAECIEMGMQDFHSSSLAVPQNNKSKAGNFSDDSSILSEDTEKLQQECIESVMPKPKTEFRSYHSSLNSVLTCQDNRTKSGEISEDSGSEKLLEECIESTMPKPILKGFHSSLSIGDKKSKSDISSDDSDTERLLQECIKVGESQFSGFRPPLSNASISKDHRNKRGDLSDDTGSSLITEQELILESCVEGSLSAPPTQQKRVNDVPSATCFATETCPKMKQDIVLPQNPDGNLLKQMPRQPQAYSKLSTLPIPVGNKAKAAGDISDDSGSSLTTELELLLEDCIEIGARERIIYPLNEHNLNVRSQPISIECKSRGGYFPEDISSSLALERALVPQSKQPLKEHKVNVQNQQIDTARKSRGLYFSGDSARNLTLEEQRLLHGTVETAMPQGREPLKEHKPDMQSQPTRSDRRSKGGYFSDDSCSSSSLNQKKVLYECIQGSTSRPKPQVSGSNSRAKSVHRSIPQKNKFEYLSNDSISSFNTEDYLLDGYIATGMPQPKSRIQAPSDQLRVNSSGVLPRRPSQPIKQSNQLRGDQKLARKSGESLKPPQSYSHNRQGLEHQKIDNRARRFVGREAKVMRERREMSLPAYFSTMKDELAKYQEEDSPAQFSLRSSLSDLTVDGSVAGVTPAVRQHNVGMRKEYDTAGPSRAPLGSDNRAPIRDKQSRHSFSSVSSTEEERALLQECMNIGMYSALRDDQAFNRPRIPRDVLGIAARSVSNVERRHERSELPRGTDPISRSKNANAASVAESTAVTPLLANEQRPKMSIQVADVEKSVAQDRSATEKCGSSDRQTTDHSVKQLEDVKPEIQPASDTLPASISATEETPSTDQTKSGSSKSGSQFLEASFENDFTFSSSDNCANLNNVFNRSCEESGTLVDNRMLDPDAMIESLDSDSPRFTAKLVSQASQLNKEKGNEVERQQENSTVSINDDSTWNEDSSQTELTFPTISGSAPNVITFDSDSGNVDVVDGADRADEGISNDFSSVNTNTMTESTLIAIEANKMVTVFKEEAELSQSIASAKSLDLDLDSIMPPSQLNSLTGSVTGFEKGQPKSPKAVFRKKSLPSSLLVKRALSNSLNQGSSLESLYNNSLGNIEGTNPPSEMQNLGDMESSIISVASLPLEGADINNPMEKAASCNPHPIFNVKQQFAQSTADLEMINPPSIFNDITDMCNSLADVATEIIGTETSTFEDCLTHVPDDSTLPLDPTEFSDANSLTPIHSDFSSAETTPKRTSKSLSKSMMTKQRRNLARDRYKTYVVAAEKVMQESIEMETKERTAAEEKSSGGDENLIDDYQTSHDKTEGFDSLTYTVKSGKITPKERRKMDRARFETRVLDESSVHVAKVDQSPDSRASSASPSPTRSKLSIRKNFMQKRLENKERFRTQTVSESSFGSPELSTGSPPCESNDIHALVEKEANLVLKNIRDSKCLQDEMLDFETLSLLSNDDDSEHNSGVAVNYNTYHKSWTSNKPEVPVVAAETVRPCVEESLPTAVDEQPTCEEPSLPDETLINSPPESEEEESKPAKSKIVKPIATEEPEPEEQPKGIRGRRKMLYSKANAVNKVGPKTIKPAKTMAVSSLVKNVTSTIKSGNAMKNVTTTRAKSSPSIRPPMPSQVKSSGYGYTKSSPNRSGGNSPKHSPKGTPPLERQGTFTKDESSPSNSPKASSSMPTPPSKIPSFGRQIARAVPSKTPLNNNNIPSEKSNIPAKSLSADRTNKNTRLYNRSTSADSREPVKKLQASSSTHSLKNEPKAANGALGKRSGIPSLAQRSQSNVSVASNGCAKKQVTSKIASLWKRVEESKARQFPSQDKRVWIHSENESTKPSLVLESDIGETSPSLASPHQE
ncbi:adenomatous polyposis coli protein isoform X4 [Dendroctonus ponderosae]|uniref:adenomatous polyposis coli protein isoform X4 n=1 Tax=Dendroctonus ponderosae TaxID=77166 RepID=UPI00203664A7|nr:adenomatous polyposis coli protein isoform X4 [Dendroctonus ponderosae]